MGIIGARTSIAARPHLVTFQNPGAAVPDGDGGFTQTWVPLSPPTLHMSITPATAKDLERVAAGTVLSTASHIVTGPYHPDVTTKTRLTWEDRHGRPHAANVTGVTSPEERNVEMVITAVEVVP